MEKINSTVEERDLTPHKDNVYEERHISPSCPKTSEEVQPVTTLWEELSTFEKEDGDEGLSEDLIAKTLFVDKTRLLDAIAVLQTSIIYRAVRACDIYFEWMKKRNGTDKMTYLRPRIRIDTRYQTVEMSWVRRLSRSHVTKPGDVPTEGNLGRTFKVKTKNGSLTVFAWYDYLKKGQKDRYSNSIFKNEPAWVKKLGSEIEDTFESLRKEQKILSAMRRQVNALDALQLSRMNESTIKELNEWSCRDLQALYSPDIDLKGTRLNNAQEE